MHYNLEEFIVLLDRKKRFYEILPILKKIEYIIESLEDQRIQTTIALHVSELYNLVRS